MMSASDQVKADYENVCVVYNDESSLPCGQIESQLVKIALGDCTGLDILDLGGGTGIHAREAIELGAVNLDLVDISPGMIKVAEGVERSLDRNIIRFFEADISKPLSHLPLREGGYDVVMANWVFDHASSIDMLEGMFRNIVTYMKPGGRFVGVRIAGGGYFSGDVSRYGITVKNAEEIPGGRRYKVVMKTTPQVEFAGTSLEVTYSGSTEIYEKSGLSHVEIIPPETAQAVQADPDFWKSFLEKPWFAVVKAVKKDR